MKIKAVFALKIVTIWVGLFSALWLAGPQPVLAQDVDLNSVRVIASHFPPYSFDQNRRARGIAVDVVRRAFERLGLNPSIEIYPWARALQMVESTPNTVLFSMARTTERESAFKWIGTVIDFDVRLYKKASRTDIVINDPQDLKVYTFAGLLQDVKTDYLQNLGAYVHEVSNEENAFKMLNLGRIDLVASDKNAAEYRLDNLGLSKQDFVPVYRLANLSKPLYLVANIETDDRIVNALRSALQELAPSQ